ncbi:hypothetical protein ACFL35_04590 [Candidatus Riflebacteria bacterium]
MRKFLLLIIIFFLSLTAAADEIAWLKKQLQLLDSYAKKYVEFKKSSRSFGAYHSFSRPYKRDFEALLSRFNNNLYFRPQIKNEKAYKEQWQSYLQKKMVQLVAAERSYKEEQGKFGSLNSFTVEKKARVEALKNLVYYGKKLSLSVKKSVAVPGGETGVAVNNNQLRVRTLLYNIRRDIIMENKGNALIRLSELERLLKLEP